MMRFQCVHLNIRSVLFILFACILNGIKFTQTAHDSGISDKSDNQKTISVPQRTNTNNLADLSSCPSDIECNKLNFPCIFCNYNTSCVYGKQMQVTCEAQENVHCKENRQFVRQAICRYCYQVDDPMDYDCVQKASCSSSQNEIYRTNCTVHNNVLCLGHRTFLKNVRCNWTQGYSWSSTLLLSLTLGGFGVDRFYLGHWQEGIGKLFSFGGLGIWTLIDVILISLHYLGPADGSLYI